MMSARRLLTRRGFSIVEALVAMSLVVLALVGVFGAVPYTYRTLQDDALRAEASTAAHRYLDQLRVDIQAGAPLPQPTQAPLTLGDSIATGLQTSSTAAADLSATCTQPDGPSSSLFDCVVTVTLDAGAAQRPLPSLETFVTRQLP